MERFGNGIVSVLFDTSDDEVDLSLVEEWKAKIFRGPLGKIDNQEEASNADNGSEDSLKDENPPPAGNARENARDDIWIGLGWAVMLTPPCWSRAVVFQLGETVGQDSRESGRHGSDEVENSISLLEVVAWIPAAEKVCTTWEETSLENTKDQSDDDQISPLLDEATAHHSDAP